MTKVKKPDEKNRAREKKYVRAYPRRAKETLMPFKDKITGKVYRAMTAGIELPITEKVKSRGGRPKELPLGYRDPNKWEVLPPMGDVIPKKKKEKEKNGHRNGRDLQAP